MLKILDNICKLFTSIGLFLMLLLPGGIILFLEERNFLFLNPFRRKYPHLFGVSLMLFLILHIIILTWLIGVSSWK